MIRLDRIRLIGLLFFLKNAKLTTPVFSFLYKIRMRVKLMMGVMFGNNPPLIFEAINQKVIDKYTI